MKDTNLKDIDSEDLEDLLLKIESSFDIKFVDSELIHIFTFGQLCDHITSKIQLVNRDNCTSQQAFYKLRQAISHTLLIDPKSISTNLNLIDIFPKKSRRSIIKEFDKYLGFKLNVLGPPNWVTMALFIVFFFSLIALAFIWQIGLSGLIFSLVGFSLANKFGKELDLKTVGQLADKITQENYLLSRRDPDTFNKNEIESILTNWFIRYCNLDKSNLTRETTFR